MRKLLLLFAVMLSMVGAWAQKTTTCTVSTSTGTGVSTDAWTKKWTSNDAHQLEITVGANNMTDNDGALALYRGQNSNSTYQLKVSSLYRIVSYSFNYELVGATTSTLKLKVGDVEYTPTSTPQELRVENINAQTASFQLLNVNHGIKVTNFNVVIELPVEYKYVYKLNDEVIKEEDCRSLIGTTYQTPQYSYVEFANVPQGNVSAEDEGKTFDISVVKYNLPFELSASYSDAHWYYMHIRSNNKDKKWVSHAESTPYANAVSMTADNYSKWAFMGDPLNGIQVLNMAAGDGYTLGYDGLSSNSNVHMKEGSTSWTIEQGTNGFVLRQGVNQYAHDMGSKLQMWDSESAKADAGSAFNVESVDSRFYQQWGNHYPWTKEEVAEIPEGVTLCHHHTEGSTHVIRKAETKINALGGNVEVTFTFTGGNQMLMIAGVDLVKEEEVKYKKYHEGKAGAIVSNNVYTLSDVEAGEYTLRYFVCEKINGGDEHKLDGTQGMISVTGATRSAVSLRYDFVIDGEIKTSEVHTVAYGNFFPEVTTQFPYGIRVTKPHGTVSESVIANSQVSKTIEMEEVLPFYKSASFEEATWYVVDMHCNDSGTGDVSDGTNRYVWTYVPESATNNVQLPKERSKQSTLFTDNKLWCFIGNAYDGFKIYNKVAGASLTLNKNTDGNTVAQMSPDGNNATSYILHSSKEMNGAICFKPKGHGYYLNTQKNDNLGVKVLQGWNDNDGGSSCRFFTPTDFIEDAILAEFDPNIPACAVGTKKMLDRDVHALLSQTLSTIQADGWETSVITPELTNIIEGLSTSNDLYEIGAGYYLIKNTGDAANNQNWYLTHKKNNNQDCLWAMGISGTANADYIWKLEAVEGGYKMLCPNLGKYFQLKTATNGGDNNTYITYGSNDANTMHFEVSGQTKFSIKNADNQNIRTEGDGQVNYWSGEAGEKWYLISATDMEIVTSITEAGAATLYTSVPLNIPEGVTAKYVKAEENEGSTGVLRYTKLEETIPANTAVVLTGEADDYAFTVANDVEAVTDNVLFGYATETDATGDTGIYALANKANGVAFYPFVGETYKAGKAYLNISALSASEVRFFNIFDEGEETAVEDIQGAEDAVDSVVYDLAGRRVQKAQKGLYIVNGKKVIK